MRYPVEVSLEEAFRGTTMRIRISDPGEAEGGQSLEVKVPPGVDTGSTIHLSRGNGRRRDVNLEVTVRSHPGFRRSGSDLYTDVQVPLEDLVLGAEVPVTTLKGKVMLTVSPETQNGQTFRLAGQGMPQLGNPKDRGDLYATVRAVLPSELTDRERELFEELRRDPVGRGGDLSDYSKAGGRRAVLRNQRGGAHGGCPRPDAEVLREGGAGADSPFSGEAPPLLSQ